MINTVSWKIGTAGETTAQSIREGGRRMKPGRRAARTRKSQSAGPEKAAHGSLHRSVAQDIGARILNGEYPPGALLPNEAAWCRRFGVSRTAVREAIKMLMGKGLILSRPRIGSRGQSLVQWNLLD